ncbi:non-ribosomal peptide synthetase [Bacillus velezensis]|uniref:non-ribosomal peptide synthetase n=1 Tax=Bacillus velezensis TaxID=492670 RepID=UPI001378ABBE|nr:non-ribosomal peptide synthetase [Bacillus velezensis]NCT29337.1 amino acid adenylation domain-containing protein [Bacillus velezensis]UUI52377.1 non-ribosomal peptide synthetase [Bacillus velezensis]WIA25486.1 non-ribosomal peptide synthetase [Bacillus velezensis]
MNKNSNRVQYKDFSVWQNFYDISKQEEYWKREFAGEIARVDLKTDFLRPQIQSFRGDNVVAKVKEPLSSGVKNLALKHGATEFMVTLSVFILLLAKYSRQKDIIVGTTVSGRVHADTKGMLGMFVNTLVIKGEVSPDETFEHLILAVKEKCLQAYDNQEYQFEDLVEAVEEKRDLSRNPIFDFMFGLKEKKKPTEMQGLLGGKSAFIKRNVSKFDLSVLVECMPEGYEIDFEYCTDLFKQETIEYMARHYVTLLEEAITHPGKKLKDLHMLDLREQEKILVDFNATNVEYSREQTAVSLFENQVEKTAGNIALKFDDNKMTYAELNERANQLARTLRDLGVAPNDLVALVTERSMEMIVGILAIIKAGGAYVPINPEYPDNRIHYMLEDSSPKIVLTYKNKLPGKVEIPVLDLEDENNYANETDNLLHVNRSNDLVYCIYTSGTTGNPKGVLIEHRNVVNMWVTYQETFALSDKDTVLQFANISFDQAVGDIFPALCNGAALCIVPKHLTYDMEQLQKYIDRNNVTTASLTPKLIDGLCVDALPTLRLLESGGEAGSLESLKKWAERVEVLNTYGPTESTVNATSFRVNTDSTSISIGRPIANTKVYLLNEMELCGIGIPGELCIAGDGLARGYLNQPELTDKKFIKNPFGEGKLYRTGDLARWQPDGNIEYLGRIDDEQVKVRGYRIELGEIESVLRKQSNIADAVVIVKEVGNDDILCAYLIAEKGQELSIPQIKEAVREEVTEYMIPAFMIQIDEFPLTINGKLDKTRLPEPDMLESLNYVPPSNKTEQAIVDVFEEILGISPVGIEDSFFELGGHSLKATAAINAIEKKTGIRLPVKEIFSSPTPSMLARKIEAAGEGEYSPIPQAEQREAYPASSTQKRLFILDQMEGNSTAYNMASALEVTGNLDVEKIQQAIDRLIQRHESLRTSFVMTEGETLQVIADEVFYQVEYEETDSYSDADMEQFVRPFDIGTAPLMRFKVVKERNRNKYILLFDMHHIISDHQTLNLLIEDFSRLYNGEELQPLELQYKDYSEWMRARNLESQRDYWKEVFKEEAPVLDLVTDYPRPKTQSYKGAQVSVQLSKEQKVGIENINKQNGTTDYMTLLAVFMIELHKYSRQQDIVVGTPISGRVHQDTETIAGMFVNTLAMRGYPRGEKTFLEFLSEIKELALNAYENQEYPFEELVEEVEVRRDLSRNPLFDVMFTMQNDEDIHLAMGEAQVDMLGIHFIDAKFDLDLQATAHEEGYALDLVYCSDLFTQTSAQVILEHFKVLLDRVIANPDMKLSELHMVSEVEQQRILTVFNNTHTEHTEYAQHHTAVERFEKHAEQTPEKTVIEYETGVLRYGEVNRKANALAWELISLGVQPNDRVAIMTTLEAETIIGILGVLKSGAAYVPIDPATPKERIEHILNDAAPKVILTREKTMETEVPFISMNLEDLGEKETNPACAVEKSDIAYLIYTSGTTGKPKGVAVTRGNLDHYLSYADQEYQKEACTTVLMTSLSFDLSVTSLFLPLISGGSLLLKGGDTEERLRAALKDNRVTFLKLTPSHLKMLETYADGVDVPNLETLIVGGEEFTTDTAWKTQKLLGESVKIHNEYGPTETTVGCCDYVYSSEKDKGLSVGIGHPIANMQLYILNEMELCGVGVPGELCIAGDGVAKGYLNQPELTAEKFIDNPYGEGKLYRSGDLARWLPNGEMEYLGRIDEQVKIRGYRIELYEIESVLRNQPGISDVAVVALEVGGDKSICAYLIPTNQEQQLDMSEIKNDLRDKLPEYMLPGFMMQIDALPLTPNGKLDAKALPEPNALAGQEYMPPRTKTEKVITDIFEEILGISPVGIEDSFFELGGHSLKATAAINAIEKKTGIRLPVKEIFSSPTPVMLSRKIEAAGEGEYSPIPQAEQREAYPASSTQKRLFILDQMEGNSTAYNMASALEVTGNLDVEKIQQAIDRLIKRHESLRTSFVMTEEGAYQVIADEVFYQVEYEETDSYSDADMEQFVRPFDIGTAPLMRFKVVKERNQNNYILLFDMHHIISDHQTLNLLIEDFSRLYNGEELQPLEIQYKDYSEWMRGRNLESQRNYWKEVFKEEAPVLDLVTDYPRPKIQSYKGAQVSVQLSREQKAGIQNINKQQGTTDYMTLLAVFMIELHKYSRQQDIVVGTPISGRVHQDTETIAGMFVNTLAMRGYPRGEKTFLEFLSEIKELALNAYENQEYPFEELVEEVEVRRDLSRNPLFDVMFTMQNNEEIHLAMGEAQVEMLGIPFIDAKFDLDLQATAYEEGYALDLVYCSDLFTETSAQVILEHFKVLLDRVIANPEMKLSELYMVSEVEQQRILTVFNDTHTEYAQNNTAVERFEKHAEQTPEKTVIEYETGVLRYGEVNRKANALAWELISLGVQPNDRVAIMTTLEAETIIGILGVLKSGAAYVPIDPATPKERIEHILNDAAPKVILTREKTMETEVPFISMNLEDLGEKETNPACAVEKSDIAYLIYTSGTTGKPKGVAVTRGNLDHYLSYADQEYQKEACTTVLMTSLSFDLSVTSLFLPLISGGSLLLKGGDTEERLRAALKDNRVTFLKLTPSHLKMLETYADGVDVPNLETLIVGGEEFTTDTAWKTQKLLGESVKIHNEYGPTETTVGCCDYVYSSEKDKGLSVGIGHPIANMQLYILNEMELCGVGVPGELCIAGDGVAKGYLNQPELTAEKFIDNPYGEGKLYRSGDLARWLPNGEMEYLGRIDEQVKIRGYRIELYEIESVLRNQPGISDVAVVALEVGGDKSICAYLIPTNQEQQLDMSEIKNDLRDKLPEYMLPGFMMQIDALPLTPNGKLDAKALPEPNALAGQEYMPPRTKTEKVITDIFEEILGISPVGIEDSFFELGGDSIKAIKAVSKLREKGYKLSFAALMYQQTPRKIGENIQMGEVNQVYEQGEINGASPLTPIQLEFFNKNHVVPNHYNQALMLRSDEPFDIPSLKTAITEIIKHHDALRNVYDGQRQITLSTEESKLYDWYEKDYTKVQDVSKEIEYASDKLQASIDLATGPLVKVGLFHSDSGDHLLICVHHLVIDGVSWRILLEDLFSGYRQIQETGKITLPMKTASYKEWANALTQYAKSEVLSDEIAYWKNISDKSNSTETFKSTQTASGQYKNKVVKVDSETTKKLLLEAGKTYKTEINDLLLASLTIAVKEWRNSKYLTIEMEGHGRETIDREIAIDRTVGWFTSVYPIILETKDTVEESILEAKQTLKQVPNHGIGYGILRYLGEHSGLEMSAAITFNYLGELDNEIDRIEGISMSGMPLGRSMSEKNSSGMGLSLNGAVLNGQLEFDIIYDTGLYTDEDAQTLVLAYERAIKDVVETCLTRKGTVKMPLDETLIGDNRDGDLKCMIQKQLNYYGDNYIKTRSTLECPVLTGQEDFLRPDTEIITEIITIEGTAENASLSLRGIISRQGALRTKLNQKMTYLEEYDYSDEWEIPVVKGTLELSAEQFKEIVNEMSFLTDDKLLSRFLIVEIDADHCLVLSAIHHLIWDGVSQDLFKVMLHETLNNRLTTPYNYSFIEYCKMIKKKVDELEIPDAQESNMEEYIEAAKQSADLVSRRDTKRSTEIHVKLNELQYQKFSEQPINTAVEFISRLMYSDLPEELNNIPVSVLTHNRDEFNKEMLGLTLNLDYSIYDRKSKTQKQLLSTSEKSSINQSAITEKLFLIAQKYDFNEMSHRIPIINYQGVLDKFASRDDISLEKMFLQTQIIESEDFGVSMHFYIQNSTLIARITGITIEEELLNDVMKNI